MQTCLDDDDDDDHDHDHDAGIDEEGGSEEFLVFENVLQAVVGQMCDHRGEADCGILRQLVNLV